MKRVWILILLFAVAGSAQMPKPVLTDWYAENPNAVRMTVLIQAVDEAQTRWLLKDCGEDCWRHKEQLFLYVDRELVALSGVEYVGAGKDRQVWVRVRHGMLGHRSVHAVGAMVFIGPMPRIAP